MAEPPSAEQLSVACPECEARAVIAKEPEQPAKIACTSCSFRHTQVIDQRLRYGMQRIYAGAPVDPYFGLRLWTAPEAPEEEEG